ncbi:NUDIX domain-containing protein [Kroppenstedtia eburnea]|uniref:Isopentenyldiphosphate isomerase n=1 Tax=Kroppenstedtia eburnea TaxID=714067 RepID=A0A1N7Q5I2_9BACL|nr:NUDIX domain-containing protein [Kroppenstedtia eburnea]QKI83179.1 NUDIX domain-containing protein [Kroppenstedtia eburnea]SIT18150.1 Isopentenyldiphosphate isomerase [Kroppenstedtia eburnea]
MAEMLDIMGPDLQVIGVADRERVHREGLWHHTFDCWLYRRVEGKIYPLFQLRHPDKKAHPHQLDITAAGHLLSGEGRKDGVRELEEELGLSLHPEELVYLGVHREEMRGEGWIDREHRHVHLHQFRGGWEDFRLQPSEVSGLFEAELSEVVQLMEGKRGTARFQGFTGTEASTGRHEERRVTWDELVPHSKEYYRTVFQALEAQGNQE